MAIRYRSEFANINGTEFRIDIHDVDYVGGTINDFTVGSDGFVLTYDGDTSNRLQHILPSECEIQMLVQSTNEEALVTQLSNGNEGRHLVHIQHRDPGGTYEDYWFGVLFADQIEIADQYYPYSVTLTASDDLKALEGLEYKSTPSLAYTGSQNLMSHFRNCLSKLRYYDILPAVIFEWDEWYTCNQVDTGNTMLEDVYVNHWKLTKIEDGVTKYRSTYEILEQLLGLLGLRMAQQNGRFVVQSIFAAQDGPTTILRQFGTKSALIPAATQTRSRDSIDSNLVRLSGWTRTHLNPLAKVTREYEFPDLTFAGWLQFYNSTSTALSGSVTTLITYADDVFEQDDQVSCSLQFRLKHTADGTLTGDARACRVMLKAQIRIGQYYVKREATFASTTITTNVVGGTAEVPTFSYGAITLTTNSADRIEFVTEPLVMNAVEDLVFDYGFTTPGLAADLSNGTLSVSFDAVQIDSTGSEVSTYDSQMSIEQVRQVRIIPAATFDIEGDTAVYSSTNSTGNDAREVYEMLPTFLGDNLGDVSGSLACDTTTGTSPVQSWTGYTGETGEIHKLLCTDYLAGQSSNIRVERGDLREVQDGGTAALKPLDLILHDSVNYALFNLSYAANAATYSVEMFELVRDDGDITEVTPVRNDTGGSAVVNDVIGTISDNKFGSNIEDIASSVPEGGGAVETVNGVSPDGSGDVTIDSDDVGWTGVGGGSVTSAIGANTSNIDNLKSYVVAATDKIELREDANNKVTVDGATGTENIALTVDGTDVFRVNGSEAIASVDTEAPTLEANTFAGGLILKDSTGTRWRVQVQTDGTLRTTSL